MATKTATPSLDSLFAKADKQVKSTSKQATTPASNRPILNLTAELEEEVKTFIEFHAVSTKIKTQCDNQKDLIKEGCFEAYTEYVWDRKSAPPSNPKVEVNESGKKYSAIFQVKAQYKIEVAIGELADDQAPEDAVVAAILDVTSIIGMSEQDVIELVNNELDFTPERGFKSFTKIFQDGTDEEKVSLTKLMIYIMSDGSDKTGKSTVDAFTTEDRLNLMTNTAKVAVIDPKKFMDRLPNYVSSLEQLRAVLSVIKPQLATSSVNFMKGSNVAERTDALQGIANNMLETSE